MCLGLLAACVAVSVPARAWEIDGGGAAWSVQDADEAWKGHGTGNGNGNGRRHDNGTDSIWLNDGNGTGELYGLTIHIFKERRQMLLKQGDHVLRTFGVRLGRQPVGTKEYRGDNRTPEGQYYVSEKKASSRFHRFLGISYPNRDDADRAFSQRLISANEWADIFVANVRRSVPPSSTLLGGRVGIHGLGGRQRSLFDWTEGCIAIGDAEIEYLYEVVPVGTPVIITN